MWCVPESILAFESTGSVPGISADVELVPAPGSEFSTKSQGLTCPLMPLKSLREPGAFGFEVDGEVLDAAAELRVEAGVLEQGNRASRAVRVHP